MYAEQETPRHVSVVIEAWDLLPLREVTKAQPRETTVVPHYAYYVKG